MIFQFQSCRFDQIFPIVENIHHQELLTMELTSQLQLKQISRDVGSICSKITQGTKCHSDIVIKNTQYVTIYHSHLIVSIYSQPLNRANSVWYNFWPPNTRKVVKPPLHWSTTLGTPPTLSNNYTKCSFTFSANIMQEKKHLFGSKQINYIISVSMLQDSLKCYLWATCLLSLRKWSAVRFYNIWIILSFKTAWSTTGFKTLKDSRIIKNRLPKRLSHKTPVLYLPTKLSYAMLVANLIKDFFHCGCM